MDALHSANKTLDYRILLMMAELDADLGTDLVKNLSPPPNSRGRFIASSLLPAPPEPPQGLNSTSNHSTSTHYISP